MFFSIAEVNGMAQTGVEATSLSTETSGDLSRFFFTSDTEISSMSGIARMSWADDGVNPNEKDARGRVSFKLKGYEVSSAEDVPEPGAILGLVALAGAGLLKKRAL